MNKYEIMLPWPGTHAAKHIDPGSGIVAVPHAGDKVVVYFEGNRYDAENLRTFEERVHCAAGRLFTKYPTVAFGVHPRSEFVAIGTYEFTDDWKFKRLTIWDGDYRRYLDAWLMLKPAIFKQKVPCADCPFRKEGGVSHGPALLDYANYFLTFPGSTFPCHKSVPKDDPRSEWSSWREGQVMCSGGLMLAAKLGKLNAATRIAVMNGWYDPTGHTAEELALVVDSVDELKERP